MSGMAKVMHVSTLDNGKHLVTHVPIEGEYYIAEDAARRTVAEMNARVQNGRVHYEAHSVGGGELLTQ